jgi:hypothetical protein
MGTHCGPRLDLATAPACRSARRSLRRLPGERADGPEFVHGSIIDYGLQEELLETISLSLRPPSMAYTAEGLSHFIRRFNSTSPSRNPRQLPVNTFNSQTGSSRLSPTNRQPSMWRPGARDGNVGTMTKRQPASILRSLRRLLSISYHPPVPSEASSSPVLRERPRLYGNHDSLTPLDRQPSAHQLLFYFMNHLLSRSPASNTYCAITGRRLSAWLNISNPLAPRPRASVASTNSTESTNMNKEDFDNDPASRVRGRETAESRLANRSGDDLPRKDGMPGTHIDLALRMDRPLRLAQFSQPYPLNATLLSPRKKIS